MLVVSFVHQCITDLRIGSSLSIGIYIIYKIPIIYILGNRTRRSSYTDELSTIRARRVYGQGLVFLVVEETWEMSKRRQATFPLRDKAKHSA